MSAERFEPPISMMRGAGLDHCDALVNCSINIDQIDREKKIKIMKNGNLGKDIGKDQT